MLVKTKLSAAKGCVESAAGTGAACDFPARAGNLICPRKDYRTDVERTYNPNQVVLYSMGYGALLWHGSCTFTSAMTKIELSELQKHPFIHRLNKDGSVDSICTRCFVTVGSVHGTSTEPELERTEAQHDCRVPPLP